MARMQRFVRNVTLRLLRSVQLEVQTEEKDNASSSSNIPDSSKATNSAVTIAPKANFTTLPLEIRQKILVFAIPDVFLPDCSLFNNEEFTERFRVRWFDWLDAFTTPLDAFNSTYEPFVEYLLRLGFIHHLGMRFTLVHTSFKEAMPYAERIWREIIEERLDSQSLFATGLESP